MVNGESIPQPGVSRANRSAQGLSEKIRKMRRLDPATAIQGEKRVVFKSANENLIGANDQRLLELRRRIGWICQILRFGAPITFIWGIICTGARL